MTFHGHKPDQLQDLCHASSDPSNRSENYFYVIDGRRHFVSEILPTDKPLDVKVDPNINRILRRKNLKKWYLYISVRGGETNQELKKINLNHLVVLNIWR